jgi:hypothetical protein
MPVCQRSRNRKPCMNPQKLNDELDALKKLEDIVKALPYTDHAVLDFGFYPNVVSEYGVGAQWAASIKRSTISTYDYGWTLQQATERLLDRVLYPEKYPKNED